jgi:hypothetical protein
VEAILVSVRVCVCVCLCVCVCVFILDFHCFFAICSDKRAANIRDHQTRIMSLIRSVKDQESNMLSAAIEVTQND